MWRKRQALASDQQSWRGMGVDSALWTSIDRNAGNVNTALGGNEATTTTGIVTNITIKHGDVGAAGAPTLPIAPTTVYVSDASNASVAAPSSANATGDTPYDANMNCRGSGLVFNYNYTQSQINSNVSGEDISGMRIAIISGGSGYSIGERFSMNGVGTFGASNAFGQIDGIASTAPVQPRN